MSSLLKRLRGRKARPPAADAADAATSAAFVARRRQRPPPLSTAAAAACDNASSDDTDGEDDTDGSSGSAATSTGASASATSAAGWSPTSRDGADGRGGGDKILRNSDISVSIVVKEAAPKGGGFFRRIASLMRTPTTTTAAATPRGDKGKGGRAEDNDNNGLRADSRAVGAQDKGSQNSGLGQQGAAIEVDEAEDEDEEEDEEPPSIAKPSSTCRRRRHRPPIRLRDIICWPYAADETDEAVAASASATATAAGSKGDVGRRTALAASELECLYSVRQLQSMMVVASSHTVESQEQAAPAEETAVAAGGPGGTAVVKEGLRQQAAVSLCIDSDRSSSGSQLQPAQQQQERGDTAERLTDVEHLEGFLERRRQRLADAKGAELRNGGDGEVEIGRLPVRSAEQQRLPRLLRSPSASKPDQCQSEQHHQPSLDVSCHSVSDKASSESSSLSLIQAVTAEATVASPAAASSEAADFSSVPSAGAGVSSLASQHQHQRQHQHQHQHQHQQVFADLCLVETFASNLTTVTPATRFSSSSSISASPAGNLEEPADRSTG